MRKYGLFIATLIISFFGFFSLQENVNAQSYGLRFEAYHADSCGEMQEPYEAITCMEEALFGNMNNYKITDGHIKAGEKVMVLINIEPSSDSELITLSAEIKVDPTKLSLVQYIMNEENEKTADYGILPYNKNYRKSYWLPSLTDNGDGKLTMLIYDSSSGSKLLPLTKAGTLGAIVYQVADDVQSGESFSVQFPISEEYPSATSMVDSTDITKYVTTNDYSFSILSDVSVDGTLKELTAVGNNGLHYPFGFVSSSKDDLTYNFLVPNVVSTVTFTGSATDSKNKGTTGLDTPHSLNVGPNEITITVAAESGDLTTYTINVTRLSNDATLGSFHSTNDVSFGTISDIATNKTTVPFHITSTVVTASTNHENAEVVSGTGTWNINTDNVTDYTNTYSVVVNAEDCKYTAEQVPGNICSTKTYDFEIVRTAPSTDNLLSELKVDGVMVSGFDPSIFEYTLSDVTASTTSINITATANDTLSTVSGKTGSQTVAVGDNEYIITVTAENGSTQDYKIKLHSKSNETALASLNITSTPTNGTLTPEFVSNFDDYTYRYDATVTNINVAATVKDTDKAYVSVIDMSASDEVDNSVKTMNTASANFGISTTKVGVIVTSEDGSTKTYKVKLERVKSTDATLSSIKVTGNDGKDYTVQNTSMANRFKVVVPGTVEKVTIEAIANDSNATVLYQSPDAGTTNVYTIPVGTSTKEVQIESESKEVTSPYYIEITREARKDATLKTLEYSFTESGDKQTIMLQDGVYQYTIPAVGYETSQVYLFAETKDSDANASGMGRKAVATGTNTYTILVTAQDTKVQQPYVITLDRAKNSDATLKNLAVAGHFFEEQQDSSFDLQNKFEYHLTVDETKEKLLSSEITAVATDETGARVVKTSGDLALSTTGVNTYTITVSAEDDTQKTYTILVTRPKSTDTRLGSLHITNASITPVFDKDKKDGYTLTVPYGKDEFTVEAIPYLSTSNVISGNNTYRTSETNEVVITVQSESGRTDTYKFNVVQALSDDSSLNSLSISGYSFTEEFASNKTDYSIGNVQREVNKLTIFASPANVDASISYYLGTTKIDACNNQATCEIVIPEEIGSKTISVEILAADHNPDHKTTYTISYTKVASSNNYLSSIDAFNSMDNTSLNLNIPFEKNTQDYEINVLNEVESVTLVLVSEDVKAKIAVNGGTEVEKTNTYVMSHLAVGANQVQILVTAEDNSEPKQYNVTINRANPVLSNDNFLSGLRVINGNDNTINYTLTPEFKSEDEIYNIGEIPFTLDKLKVEATKNVSSSSVTYYVNDVAQSSNVVSIPVQNGNGTIKVVVEAEDQSKKTYQIGYSKLGDSTVTLNRISMNKAFTPNFQQDTHSYTVNLAKDENSLNLTVFAANEKQVLTINGVQYTSGDVKTLSNLPFGTSTITILVTAEDGNTDSYMITVNREAPVLSSDKTLSSITVNKGSLSPEFMAATKEYTVELENEETELDLIATINDTKGSLKINGEAYTSGNTKTISNLSVGETPVIIEVIAEDNSTDRYTVVIKRKAIDTPVLSSDATLSGITVNKSSLTPSFVKGTKNYTVDLVNDETSIDIVATLNDSKASIKLNGENYTSGSVKAFENLPVGPTVVSIEVSAEDHSKETYTVTINREAKAETEKITSIEYGHTIKDGYIKTVSDKTTVTEIKDQLDNDNEKLKIYESDGTTLLSDDSYVGTGAIVKLFVDNEEVDSKIVIVKGDVTGDGVIDMSDVGLITNHYMDRVYLTGVYLLAGDVVEDDVIDMSDAGVTTNHYMDRVYIEFV